MEIDWGMTRSKAQDETAEQCLAAGREKLDRDEMEILMADVSLGLLKEYAFKAPPSRPLVLTKFDNDRKTYDWTEKTPQDKAIIYKRIHAKDDVVEYFKKCGALSSALYANAIYLEEMIFTYLNWKEKDKATQVHKVYSTYPDEIKVNSKDTLWKKRRKWGYPRR